MKSKLANTCICCRRLQGNMPDALNEYLEDKVLQFHNMKPKLLWKLELCIYTQRLWWAGL